MNTMEGARPSYLSTLLRKAYPTIKDFLNATSGATSADVIMLCLHCMMVDDGFTALDMETYKPIRSYAPPPGWNSLQEEWIVTYQRGQNPNRFRLHCAIQSSTGRVFVHASEQEVSTDGTACIKASNIQVLGIQLENYAYAEVELTRTQSWENCLKNERTLKEMFQEFVLLPLWARATQEDDSHLSNATRQRNNRESYQSDRWSTKTVWLGLMGIAGVTYWGYWYLSSKTWSAKMSNKPSS